LYRGYFWYASHCSLNYSVQIAMYETCIAHYKREYPEKYLGNEFYYISQTAFLCGAFGSALSNPLEVISVNKQTDPTCLIRNIVRNQGLYNLLSRGILARTCYHSTQAVALWLLIHYTGMAFNVDLTEIA
jgi:hypothetical protein